MWEIWNNKIKGYETYENLQAMSILLPLPYTLGNRCFGINWDLTGCKAKVVPSSRNYELDVTFIEYGWHEKVKSK